MFDAIPPLPASTPACRLLRWVVVACFAVPLVAFADEPATELQKLKNLSLEQIMDVNIPTVYGAAKHTQKSSEAPSAVTVVTREEIQAYGHRTLGEILRSVRDLYVTYDRNYGYLGARGVNRPGDFGGRTLILVDGQRVNEPVFDSAGVVTDFPIDVDMIERVEIIRGPGSALYGNNAFMAVVNVVTRTAANSGGVEVSSEAGSYDTLKERLTYSKAFKGGLSMLLSATQYDSAGPNDYFKEFDKPGANHGVARGLDGDHFTSGLLNMSYGDFTLGGYFISRHKDVPTAALDTIFGDPRFYTVDQRSHLSLGFEHEFHNGWSLHADVSWNTYFYDGDYPVIRDPALPARTTINHDVVNAHWWVTEIRASKKFFESHLVTIGAEWQENSMQTLKNFDMSPRLNYLRNTTNDTTYGLYIQDEWQVTNSFTLTGGLRYDDVQWSSSTFNPRLGVVWHPLEKTTLKLLYGEALRAPNVYERVFMADTHSANPFLEPERVRTYEVDVEQEISPSLRVSLSGFRSHISNLITQGIDGDTGKLTFGNLEEADTNGGSIELEARLPHGIKGRMSYTLQKTCDCDLHKRLSNSPTNLAKLSLMAPLAGDNLLSGFELQYTSGVKNSKGVRIDGYVLANWTLLAREITPHLDVSCGVYNLFDTKYSFPAGPEHIEEALQQDGRTFRLKFTYRF